MTRVLRPRSTKFAFHHSLSVRRPRSDERVARDMCKIRISPQFWASDDHEVTRGLPPVSTKPTRRKKKKKFLKSLDPQPFSEALLSTVILSHSQQLFSAQSFSAILSSSSQHNHSQPFSAALLSTQQFSAALLSSHSQQPFSAKSCCCGQRLVVS